MKAFGKVIGIFVLTFLSMSALEAQNKLYVPFNQLRFSGIPAVYDNVKIINTSGTDGVFKSKPCFGGEITISYYQNIAKWFGMSLGVGVSSTPYNTSFSIVTMNASSGQSNVIEHSDYNPQSMLVIPLSASMLIPTKNKAWFCNVELGAKCNVELFDGGDRIVYYGGDFTIYGSDMMDAIKENSTAWVQYNAPNNLLFSYFVKVGFLKLMKRNNSWNLNIVANYSPQKLSTGSYGLKSVGGNISGSFEQNINFVGIEVAYGLTLCKKKGLPKDI